MEWKVQATSTFAKSHKMVKCMGNNIGRLPDEILVSVLSLLTIKEAVRASVLSKRWLDLWKHVTGSLDFDASKILQNDIRDKLEIVERERPRYMRWVNKVINLHQGPTIREFRAHFQFDASHASDVDKWIKFAIHKRVERLELDFDFGIESRSYLIPEHIFVYIRSPRGLINIQSLRYLSLDTIDVAGEQLEFFLFNCPMLEELRVVMSDCLKNLRVAGSSLWLKRLCIQRCFNVESIDISAPKLVSFAYIGPSARLLVADTPMLVDVTIGGALFKPITDAFIILSRYLSQLETLTLSETDADAEVDIETMRSLELANLKNLTLEVDVEECDSLLGWITLLKASPILQKLRVESWCGPCNLRRGKLPKPSRCPLKCLKVVEFVGFVAKAIDIELISYLIENAPALEKIAIYCGERFYGENRWLFKEDKEKKRAKRRALELERRLPRVVNYLFTNWLLLVN